MPSAIPLREAGAAPSHRASEWFEGAVLRALPDLLGAARRLTRNAADAEDLVAEAVARAWSAREQLKEPAAFRGWIFRILTNTCISQRRSRKARPETELPDEADGEEFSLFERVHQPVLLWWGNPETDFLNRLLREDLQRAVDSLPEDFRAVVVLADLQGLSYQEIADVLEVPIGTVRSRLARARSRLQKALWAHAVDAGIATQRTTEGEAP